jgi:Uma2 family endonuclease
MSIIPSTQPGVHPAPRFTISIPPGGDRAAGMFVTDPSAVEALIASRQASGADRWDEVWDGVYVMNPLPNNEHQDLVTELVFNFRLLFGRGAVFPGVNLSDREIDWQRNYRGPDVVVQLPGGRGRNLGTHWIDGADFLVEILSPGDRSREKLDFYAAIGAREVMIVDRSPWVIELYRLGGDEMKLVGASSLSQQDVLRSSVLPLSFRLVASQERPQIEVLHHDGQQRWLA